MNRLTKRYKDGSYTCNAPLVEIADRLAAYEDTGLTPEEVIVYKAFADKDVTEGVTMGEIKRFIGGESENLPLTTGFSIQHLIDLGRAEREGRLVVLPCKVGDTVWVTLGGIIEEAEVESFGFFPNMIINVEVNGFGRSCTWGKSVFVTREAAESALKEMGVQ